MKRDASTNKRFIFISWPTDTNVDVTLHRSHARRLYLYSSWMIQRTSSVQFNTKGSHTLSAHNFHLSHLKNESTCWIVSLCCSVYLHHRGWCFPVDTRLAAQYWPLTPDSLSARFIRGPAEGDGSRGRAPHLRGFWRRGDEVLLSEQRHRRRLASAAARPRGTRQTHTLLTHANYQSEFTTDKNGIQGHFGKQQMECKSSNDERAVKVASSEGEEKGVRSGILMSLSSLHASVRAELHADAFPTRPSQRCRWSSTWVTFRR